MDIATSHEGWTPAITHHLLALAPRDRRQRFLAAVSDVGIRTFCAQHAPHTLVTASEAGRVIGIAEVHMDGEDCEIALSVDANRRGQGIGGALFARALDAAVQAGARGARVYYAAGNAAVRRMCQHHGAVIHADQDAEEAWITLHTC